MAGDEHRDLPFPVELQNELPDLNDPLGVQAVDGLVQYQKVRIPRQGHGDAQALLHAQGEVPGLFLPRVLQPHQLQKLRDAVVAGHAQHPELLLQIVLGGEVQVDGGRLHHRAHAAADLGDLLPGAVRAVEEITARRGGLQAADHPDQGGFTCPVPAHKAVNTALGHVHGEVVQGLEVFIVLAQPLGGQYIFHDKASVFKIACAGAGGALPSPTAAPS